MMLYAFWLILCVCSIAKITPKKWYLTTLVNFFHIGDGKTPFLKCDVHYPKGPKL